jgi:hypothetical protein
MEHAETKRSIAPAGREVTMGDVAGRAAKQIKQAKQEKQTGEARC